MTNAITRAAQEAGFVVLKVIFLTAIFGGIVVVPMMLLRSIL